MKRWLIFFPVCMAFFITGLSAEDDNPKEIASVTDFSEIKTEELADLCGIYYRLGDQAKADTALEEVRRRDPVRAKRVEESIMRLNSQLPAAAAHRMLGNNDPIGAIKYLENLKSDKYGKGRFPYANVLAEAHIAAGNTGKALAIVQAQLQSGATPPGEREEASILLAELGEDESVLENYGDVAAEGDERTTVSHPSSKHRPVSEAPVDSKSGQDVTSLKMEVPGISPLDRSFRDPKLTRENLSGLDLTGDYQNHPDGDLYGIRAEFSQFVTQCLEIGLRARHLSVQLARGGSILAGDDEVYAAEAFLRMHRQSGYTEIWGGSGSHDLGSGGFAFGKERRGCDNLGFRFAGMANSPVEDSIQMIALDATQDAVRFDLETGIGVMDFYFRGDARSVELEGQEIGSGFSLTWALSHLIWENEMARAQAKLSYVGNYSRFDGENIPLSLQPAMGITPTALLNGNTFFLDEIHQQGVVISYVQNCGSCLQIGGSSGMLGDIEDDQIEFFAGGGTFWLPRENVRIGLEAGYFSDGSVMSQDNGSHTRVQGSFQTQF